MSSDKPERWSIYEARPDVNALIELAASALDIASRCADLREQVTHVANAQAILESLAAEIIPVVGTGLQRSWDAGVVQGKEMVGVIVPAMEEPAHLPVASAYCGLLGPDNIEIHGEGYERQLVTFIQPEPEAEVMWTQNDNVIEWTCADGRFEVAAIGVFEGALPFVGEDPISVVLLEDKVETRHGFSLHLEPGHLQLHSRAGLSKLMR